MTLAVSGKSVTVPKTLKGAKEAVRSLSCELYGGESYGVKVRLDRKDGNHAVLWVPDSHTGKWQSITASLANAMDIGFVKVKPVSKMTERNHRIHTGSKPQRHKNAYGSRTSSASGSSKKRFERYK
jgi:hypothetical protein